VVEEEDEDEDDENLFDATSNRRSRRSVGRGAAGGGAGGAADAAQKKRKLIDTRPSATLVDFEGEGDEIEEFADLNEGDSDFMPRKVSNIERLRTVQARPSPARLPDELRRKPQNARKASSSSALGGARSIVPERQLDENGVRQRIPWSKEEERAVLDGHRRYDGQPNMWASILEDPSFRDILKNRTNVDIKDKYRNLMKRR
jgi:Myb-like DNA-binding domain